MYKSFAAYYDKIFPRNERIVSFLNDSFKEGHILDLACGTGEYSIALAHQGFQVSGYDLQQQMIDYAKIKAKEEKVTIDFKVLNMLELEDDCRFDGLMCIGNALVHLNDEDEVKLALKKMYQALKNDKPLVIQIINYDLIIKDNVKGLSTIQNDGYEFVRNYEFDGKKIHFKTRLSDGLKVFVDETLLLPIKHEKLIEYIKEAGFKNVTTRGGFTKPLFHINTDISYVITANK
ncbi:Methyltransferase type 11 [Paracholeplasma brassicae]|jgi:SAM-dependent methyltransferase|uniref:Methyltransferase type 11 n=1 Tax=Acholeplasma brassicae TaxID=61635 RepID=U4KMY0_9MOLU|nr:class I SAM-dependent methyltransferase [Paracholeplasma brassicae]CCV65617.1 Methyltransferase type 11 [Paracholeplasma brassicae]HBT60106.1 class I SAM-dependent methyltransferase [Acholeplasmataceae bacterium]